MSSDEREKEFQIYWNDVLSKLEGRANDPLVASFREVAWAAWQAATEQQPPTAKLTEEERDAVLLAHKDFSFSNSVRAELEPQVARLLTRNSDFCTEGMTIEQQRASDVCDLATPIVERLLCIRLAQAERDKLAAVRKLVGEFEAQAKKYQADYLRTADGAYYAMARVYETAAAKLAAVLASPAGSAAALKGDEREPHSQN